MKKIVQMLLLSLILFACVDEDYFGLSKYGNIKSITVSGLAGNAVIDNDSFTVSLGISSGTDLSTIVITELTLSSFAASDKQVGDTLNLNSAQKVIVTAEDGSIHKWKIYAETTSSTPQLSNGDFTDWYLTSDDYYEPGEGATNTIWGTGNAGTYTINKIATEPYDLGDGNLSARMETLDNGLAGVPLKTPISAGSIFTGVFNADNISATDPEAAIEFGTLFIGRPDSIRFKYSYLPGETNEDRQGNELDYSDACDIYALLEVRNGSSVKRLATAWFRSDEEISEMTTIDIPFVYGELDSNYPDYMIPDDGEYVSSDSVSFLLPTNIVFVATSSCDGANFAGAIGSTLILDDVEMVYE